MAGTLLPDRPSAQPILDLEPLDTAEFTDIVRDQRSPEGDSLGANPEIIGANRRALPLQRGTNPAIRADRSIEGRHFEACDNAREARAAAIDLSAFPDAGLNEAGFELAQHDRGQQDRTCQKAFEPLMDGMVRLERGDEHLRVEQIQCAIRRNGRNGKT